MRSLKVPLESNMTVSDVVSTEHISQTETSDSSGWSMRRTQTRRWHRWIARILFGCLILQFFFAGLGVFYVTSFLPHAIMGSVIILASFALPLVAWRGRLGTELTRRSWLLAALMILQGLLIDVGRVVPALSALHPVNALLLALLTFSMI